MSLRNQLGFPVLPRFVTALVVAAVGFGPLLAPAAAQDHQRAQVPGELDGRVTPATIHSTICERGYTAKVRPPRKVTDAISGGSLPDSQAPRETTGRMTLGQAQHDMLKAWGPR